MNDYIQVDIQFSPYDEIFGDVTASLLGDQGYESFTFSANGMSAYVVESLFEEKVLEDILSDLMFETSTSFTYKRIVSQNWNEEWEKNYFQPIVIENKCVIHSTFHQNIPEAEYDIVIDPKMAFGTGHHETTSLMLAHLLQMDVKGKSLLDMGCGTAVLAILAKMKGADQVVGIDIDEWAVTNAKENIGLNQTSDIVILLGGAEILAEKKFDIILANINRNILLNDIHHYAACLKPKAELIMSGFYVEDIPFIREEAEKNNLSFDSHTEKNRWVSVKFIKN
ncbi:MAG: 50S ribosomal protein L11 methyltransferase [Bacteroidales bacterium]|nr:50S ribosomal protein L11 methyltransferase [Bacteroidales bacterium]